MTKPLRFSK